MSSGEVMSDNTRGPSERGRSRRTVLILSGGLDSSVLLYHLQAEGHDVRALSIDYGQRHSRELEHARRITEAVSAVHRIVDLRNLAPLFAGSGLVDQNIEIPVGEYAAENMQITVVPNRNMIMLSIAAAWALSEKASAVSFAAHHGHHTLYADCRPEFIEALAHAIHLADDERVDLIAPFATWTKADIVRRGAELGVPFGMTWSCYKGGNAHCGRCSTCVERREAFVLAAIPDPTQYM